jgi:uncharacterized protein YdhG (YjbR/CyaY superfamily)
MTAKDVDSYISAAPKGLQGKLRKIRAVVKATAPEATERINYQIPAYEYMGPLVFFGLQKKHIGLYLRPPLVENHKAELKRYGTTKSAIHLPLDEDIPVQLIRKLVRAAMKKNEAERRTR